MTALAIIAARADTLAQDVDAFAADLREHLDGAELRDAVRAHALLRSIARRTRIRLSPPTAVLHRCGGSEDELQSRRNVAERAPVVSVVLATAEPPQREDDALRVCSYCSARFAAERSACPLCGFAHVHGTNDVAPGIPAHAEAGRVSAVCGGGSA